MKSKVMKSIFCGALAMIAVGFSFQPESVSADMGNYNFVSIDSGVTDSITVNGITVEALYRPYDSSVNSDSTYSCAAFVKRFYSQVYGRDVSGLNSTTSVPVIDSGSFQATSSPKVGDILRDNQSVHWAIVKEVSGNTITVIQQNAWNGDYTKAWVGATVQNGDSRYTFFTWSENTQSQTPAGNYTVNYQNPQIQETTAVLSAKVDNPNRYSVSQVGCYLWDANDNLLKKHVENCTRPESRFNMWYDVQGELGISLTPGTTYKYQFFVVQDGIEYPGSVQTFTTSGQAPLTQTVSGKAPVSTADTDAVTTTDDEISRSIGKLNELSGWSKEQMLECLEPAYKISEDGNTYYIPVQTLMDRPASLILTLTDDRIVRVQWRYEYSSNSDTALKQCKAFYKQIYTEADRNMDSSRYSYCENSKNITSLYNEELSLVKDYSGERPYISITIMNQLSSIFE